MSRLPKKVATPGETEAHIAETHVYMASLIQMTPDFRQKIKDGYTKDKHWTELLLQLKKEVDYNKKATVRTPSTLPYKVIDDLIYVDGRGHRLPRLCIPPSLEKDIFKMAHDDLGYVGFYRTYTRIIETLYLYRMYRRLRKYLEHCPECQV